jgi:phage terminase large subunit
MITDPDSIDWKHPDYAAIFRARLKVLAAIRADPSVLPPMKEHYRNNPADFISDWGVTYEPRNAERNLPTFIPFVLFQRQREWVDWVVGHWRAGTPGLTEKSRDEGISWLAMSLACTLCLFYDGIAIGVGSRKTEYVDKIGTYKPLLPKGRMFVEYLPEEFRAGWVDWRDAPFMRITFPQTRSIIGGEGGDDLGRGDRTSLFFVDEYAYFERPELTEMSLSQTTNCRIDVSSVAGMNNTFAQKRHSGRVDVFVFDWHDDPRKDQEWYDNLGRPESEGGKGLDPVTIAQEVDRDYSASVKGIVIHGAWVRSAIDAHLKLDVTPTGKRGMSLDVADEGADKNAACRSLGILIEGSEEWSGKGVDIFDTVQRAFNICDLHGIAAFDYDSDGLGAGVRGDARIINENRARAGAKPIGAVGFRSSEAVVDPDGIVEGTIGREGDRGRTNQDYFANRKAQGWWSLRRRFQRTHRWAVEGVKCSPDDIVSISSKCPNHLKLVAELSQPTYAVNGVGKIVINKKPGGMKSPNLGDACMIRFAPKEAPAAEYTQELISMIRQAGMRRRRGR